MRLSGPYYCHKRQYQDRYSQRRTNSGFMQPRLHNHSLGYWGLGIGRNLSQNDERWCFSINEMNRWITRLSYRNIVSTLNRKRKRPRIGWWWRRFWFWVKLKSTWQRLTNVVKVRVKDSTQTSPRQDGAPLSLCGRKKEAYLYWITDECCT